MIKTINNQTTKKEKKLRIKTLKYKKAIVVQRENFLKADEKKNYYVEVNLLFCAVFKRNSHRALRP